MAKDRSNRRWLRRPGEPAGLAGFVAGSVRPGPSAAQTGPTAVTLSNGARLFVESRRSSPALALVVALRFGTRDEADAERGVADLLRQVHIGGSEARPSSEALELPVTSVGGTFSSSVTSDVTLYEALVPARSADRAFATIGETLTRPAFTEAIVARQRKLMLDDLAEREGDADAVTRDAILAATLPGHPGVRPSAGTGTTVAALTRDVLLQRRSQTYTGANLTVVAVGNVTPAQAQSLAEAAFAALPPGKANPVRPAAVTPIDGVKRVDLKIGTAQAVVSLGFQSSGPDHPDRAAQTVLDNVMGIYSGRINTAIRGDRGLAYGAYASTTRLADVGAWIVSADTAPGDVDEVVALMLAEIRRVRDEPVSDEELRLAKGAAVYDLVMAPESAQRRARTLATRQALSLSVTDEALGRAIEGISAGDVQRVARQYLTPDRYAVVVTLPAE